MAFQAVPDVAQVQIRGSIDGQLTVNDLYFYKAAGGITVFDLNELTNSVVAWYADTIATALSDAWTFDNALAQDLTTEGGARVNYFQGTPGGTSGAYMPNNVSFAIRFDTFAGGRSGRGRNYLPAIPALWVSGNTMNAEPLNAFVSAYNLLVNPSELLAVGWLWVVVSRISAGAVRPVGVFNEVIGASATDNVLDSQRRRLPGRGR